MIREAGFKIVSRPKDGPARWRRGRLVMLHDDALAIARAEWKAKLESLEGKRG